EHEEEARVLLAELEQHLAGADAPSLAERGDAAHLRRRQPGKHLVTTIQVGVGHVVGRAGSLPTWRANTIHPRAAAGASGRRMRKLELVARRAPRLGGRPASARLSPRPREADAQSRRLNLKEHLGLRETRQTMAAETADPDAARRRWPDRGSGRGGGDDLAAVSGRADARRRVHREADVAGIGQRRPPAMDPDPHAHLEAVARGSRLERALDSDGGVDGSGGALEDSNEIVGESVDPTAS